MKNIFLKLGAISLLVAGVFTSCSDDYLDTVPKNSISTLEVTVNVDNAQMAVYGICRGMFNQYQSLSQGCNGEAYIMMMNGELPSQDYFNYQYAVGFPQYLNMEVFHETVTAYYALFVPWGYCYTMINGANQVLQGIDAAEGDETHKAFVKAQALTLRAHAYTRLLQLYAPRWEDSNNGEALCVVKRTEDMNLEDSPLVSMNEIFSLIYSDMTQAVDLFEGSSYTRTFEWEPDKAVAYGVFARAAMIKHDWATAADMAAKAREGHALMTNDQYASGFCTPNQEWMWNSSGDVKDQIYYWSFGTTYACNGYLAINYAYGAGAANIELLRQFPEEDIRCQQFVYEGTVGTLKNWYNEKFINLESLSIQNASLLRQARNYAASRKPKDLTSAPSAYVAGDDVEENPLIQYGAQLKFWITELPGISAVCFMRASEMLLIEAEAKAMLDQDGAAQALLNELNAERQPGYTCTASGDALDEEVRLYRRLELWGEGFNFFDFKRWNKAITRTGWEAGNTSSGNAPATVVGTIEPNQANGWKFNVPRFESQYNDLIQQSTSLETGNNPSEQ